jgi:hypothetical protein
LGLWSPARCTGFRLSRPGHFEEGHSVWSMVHGPWSVVHGPWSMVHHPSSVGSIAPNRLGLTWGTRIWRNLANEARIGPLWRTECLAPHPQSVWFFIRASPSHPSDPYFKRLGPAWRDSLSRHGAAQEGGCGFRGVGGAGRARDATTPKCLFELAHGVPCAPRSGSAPRSPVSAKFASPKSIQPASARCIRPAPESSMDNGRWTMDNGRWTMDHGPWTKNSCPTPLRGVA